MSDCKYCDDGLPLYAMDKNGTGVRVQGAGGIACIGHSVDDYHWPCLLVPQPGRWYEAARLRMLKGAAPPTVGSMVRSELPKASASQRGG